MNTRHAPETLSEERRIKLSNARRTSDDENRRASRKLFRPVAAVLLVGLTCFLLMQGLQGVSVRATTESINTQAANCEDPQPNNSWNLGGTVCATVTGAPLPSNGFRQRRFQWVAPNGSVAQQADITADQQNDTYTVPTSGFFRQVGTWSVKTVDNDGGVVSEARFIVRDPALASADLFVNKSGPIKATAGSNITYTVIVTNQGPDDALNVVLTDAVPANTTFVSRTQVSGPTFTCPGGAPPCTIGTLAANDSATFSLTYSVNAGAPVDTVISNTASVSSTTNELFQPDNSFSFQTTVTSASTTCTINCPASFTVDNDANQCSAVVTYSTPTTSGSCGSPPDSDVICTPLSGSTFPMGATVVNCSTQSGGTCSFTVTVHDTRTPGLPTIDCPDDVSVNEDALGSGEATVNYPAPITTGNCVTTVCDPPSGSIFQVGTTTVGCTATDSSNNTVACSFTVTVISGNCALTCPADMTVTAAAGQCSTIVNYPDPTTSGNCATVTCNPPPGSTFPTGNTLVTCTSTAGPSCDFTVTVVSGNAVTALGSAQVWIGLKNSDDVGTKFDLLAEVLRNGAVVGSGQVNDVPGGSSGFNNAVLRTISLALDGTADFCAGDTLTFRLSVRVAASSGHVSGTARLWFNDSAANSRFNATVGGVANDYFLLDGFALNTTAGPGPKRTIDVLVNRNVGGNPFKPFGTWSKTF